MMTHHRHQNVAIPEHLKMMRMRIHLRLRGIAALTYKKWSRKAGARAVTMLLQFRVR